MRTYDESVEEAFAEIARGGEGEFVIDEIDEKELEVFVGEGFLGDGGEAVEALDLEEERGFFRGFDGFGDGGDGGGSIRGGGQCY